jgi:hypothetical protein
LGWEPLAHAYNPSYSRGRDLGGEMTQTMYAHVNKRIKKKKKRGRDQEDYNLKPAQAIVHENLS